MSQGIIPPPAVRPAAPKAKMTVYYALLIIALCAMLVACLFLYLEIKRFGGFGTVKGKISQLDRPAQTFVASASSTSACQA